MERRRSLVVARVHHGWWCCRPCRRLTTTTTSATLQQQQSWQEHAHYGRVARTRRPVEWRATPVVHGVHLGLSSLLVVVLFVGDCRHRRRHCRKCGRPGPSRNTNGRRQRRIGQQGERAVRMALHGAAEQGRLLPVVARVHLGSVMEQQQAHLRVATVRGAVQGCFGEGTMTMDDKKQSHYDRDGREIGGHTGIHASPSHRRTGQPLGVRLVE